MLLLCRPFIRIQRAYQDMIYTSSRRNVFDQKRGHVAHSSQSNAIENLNHHKMLDPLGQAWQTGSALGT